MSTSQESTSFVDEAEPLPESNPTESSLDRKVGMAQKFDKEMKVKLHGYYCRNALLLNFGVFYFLILISSSVVIIAC